MKKLILTLTLALGLIASGGVISQITTSAQAFAPAKGITLSAVQKKEQTVYVTRTGEKYHRGHCRYLRRSKIPMKKSEAKAAGYTACKVCRP